MRRSAVLFGLAVLALSGAGCGEGDDLKTIFFVRVERGNAMGEIRRIDLAVRRDSTTFDVPLSNQDGSTLELPITRQVDLPSDQRGAVVVTAIARGPNDENLGIAITPGEIVPGETITLVLEFGVDKTLFDGGMPDAEVMPDAAPAALTMTPGTRDFGSAVLGSTSALVSFTIANAGGEATGPLAVSVSGAGSAAYVLDGASNCAGAVLASAASCTVTLTFQPGAEGALAAALEVTGMPGGTASASLTGSGLRPGELAIAPLTQTFGSVVTGASSALQTFTVTNRGGSATGALSATLGGTNAAQFAIASNGCSAALPAAGTCSIGVRMSPTSAGSKSASLTVTGNPGGSAVAQLSGVGLAPAALAIAPPMQDLGTVVQGNQASVTFTVSNGGGVATGALTTTLGGTAAAEYALVTNGCAGSAVAAGGSCMVTVRLTAATTGARPATLTVMGTPGGTLTANVTATVVTQGALRIAPTTQAFGSVLIGTDSAAQTFTVSNSGGSATGVPAAALSGSAAADFRISANSCTAALPAAGTCTISVLMRPSAAGGRAASLGVSATPGGATSASLSGSGLSPAALLGDATGASFGTVDVTQQSSLFTWTVRNTGGVATSTLGTTITGDTTQFVVTNNCTGTLAAGASCTVTLRFTPTSAGARTLRIVISASTGGSVQLDATGTGRALQRLTVARAGTGTGSVSSTPAGITCGADCFEDYLYGSAVTLSATATAGSSSFGGWSGACAGAGACSVTMNQAHNVTATFTLNRYTLTVTPPSNGSIATVGSTAIACGADCSEVYDHGTNVVLRATPATGYGFGSWGGACAGQMGDCTVAMTAARTVSASFTITTRNLTLSVTGPGSIGRNPLGTSCGTGCYSYDYGTVVNLTITPATGYSYTVTTGAGTCTGSGTSALSCAVTMTANATVAVTNTILQFDLTATPNGSGTITRSVTGTSCGTNCQRYDYDTSVRLTPSPSTGWAFTGWSGVCAGFGTGPCDVRMTQSYSVRADFVQQYRLFVTAPQGGGSPAPSSGVGQSCGTGCWYVTPGNTAVINSNPDRDLELAAWRNDCGGQGDPCSLVVSADGMSAVAYYRASPRIQVIMTGQLPGLVFDNTRTMDCSSPGSTGVCNVAFTSGVRYRMTVDPGPGGILASFDFNCNDGISPAPPWSRDQTVNCYFTLPAGGQTYNMYVGFR